MPTAPSLGAAMLACSGSWAIAVAPSTWILDRLHWGVAIAVAEPAHRVYEPEADQLVATDAFSQPVGDLAAGGVWKSADIVKWALPDGAKRPWRVIGEEAPLHNAGQ
jgi:hypothetical protein